jgi:hypothetical protein
MMTNNEDRGLLCVLMAGILALRKSIVVYTAVVIEKTNSVDFNLGEVRIERQTQPYAYVFKPMSVR